MSYEPRSITNKDASLIIVGVVLFFLALGFGLRAAGHGYEESRINKPLAADFASSRPSLPLISQANAAPEADSSSGSSNIVGQVASGLDVLRGPDGKLSFNAPKLRVWLSDGRELRMEDGDWKLYPPELTGPPTRVSATDFALYPERYLCQRIEVSGGVLFDVQVEGGHLALPGKKVVIWFTGTPREDIRRPIEVCAGLIATRSCAYTVIGDVYRSRDGEVIGIRASSLVTMPRNAPGRIAPGITVWPGD